MPTGSAGFSTGDVEPGIVFLWSYTITDKIDIAGNFGFFALREDMDHRFLQTTNSLTFVYSWTDRLGTYVEYFGLYPGAAHEDCEHNANTGVTYLLTDDIQLDWRIGMGLNEQAPDFFTGVGLSFRF